MHLSVVLVGVFWVHFLLLFRMLSAYRLISPVPFSLRAKKLVQRSAYDKSVQFRLFSSLNQVVLANQGTAQWGKPKSPQFVFVGGKGGVGKTTASSAIALTCSDNGFKTLIVSTDPAHSLGDALDMDLSVGKIRQIQSEYNLWGLEIDIEEGMKSFQSLLNVDTNQLASQMNLPKEMLDIIDFEELLKIFKNPPPGIDEIFALTKIFQFTDGRSAVQFDRIIIDTAPTGHTLRLLQLPQFLSNTATKILKFRAQVDRAVNMFGSFLGNSQNSAAVNAADQVIKVFEKIEALQKDVQRLSNLLKDADQTQFVVVTIPTIVAFQESQRLINSLKQNNIQVSTVICNQIISETANEIYLQDRSENQKLWISHMENFLSRLNPPVQLTQVPFVSTEVTTIYGLKYFQDLVHPVVSDTPTDPSLSRKLTIFGGKGGVGKSTSASSWAVRLSESGFKTLLVSSDPAHSLGDVFAESFRSVPTLVDSPSAKGELWALEIDPAVAISDFKTSTMNDLELGDDMSISNLLFDPKDPPPGIDELAAVAKVISFLEDGYTTPSGQVIKFDRIVLDTAPTGHTLRMLELPEFMQNFLISMRKATEKLSFLTGMMRSRQENPGETMSDKMVKLQDRMKKFEEMLHNPEETEFTVVTIPTELATSESKRLIQALQEKQVLIRRAIMNQIISSNETESYLNALRSGQSTVLKDLEALTSSQDLPLIKIPYFPTEMRTVYALRYVGKSIFPEGKL